MKKLIAITSAITVLVSASAFAKTEGNYIGLDLHRSVVSSRLVNLEGASNNLRDQSSKTGLGISYKYAFNFDKMFIAPGFFYEKLNNRNYSHDDENAGLGDSYFATKDRYGVRADFGYDVTDTTAVYATLGYANVGYTTYRQDAHNPDNTSSNLSETRNKRKAGLLYGIGAMSKINDQFSLGFEYNTQRLSVNSGDHLLVQHYKSTIDVYKMTLAYHF